MNSSVNQPVTPTDRTGGRPAPPRLPRRLAGAVLLAGTVALASGLTAADPALAQRPSVVAPTTALAPGDDNIVRARDALDKRDAGALAAALAAAQAGGHPLLQWVEYWDLSGRLAAAQQSELDDFYRRWRGSYVEDRLRNDWLLELGRRQDWANFARDYPQFRMNDDREVSCYALLTEHLAGRDVRAAAPAAWFAQRDGDTGCALMARTLFEAGRLSVADVWRKARLSADLNRNRPMQQALDLLGANAVRAGARIADNPQRYLARDAAGAPREAAELATLALVRVADDDPEAAARLMSTRWEAALPADLGAWVWASIGRESALRLSVDAPEHYQRAELRLARAGAKAAPQVTTWSDETIAWKVRAALRASAGVGEGVPRGAARWVQVRQGIGAMSPAEQREPTWVYWRARALLALSSVEDRPHAEAAAQREEALALLRSIADGLHFYGKLAADALDLPLRLPAPPQPLSAEERAAAAAHPGLSRALHLIRIGLRPEGVREWNFSLRGMGERELLAAAQRACDAEVWDRCINTSDRTREEIDLRQRFPTPFREQVVARAKAIGLDPAYVYGLIRQESRFIMDARSSVGASGLMQIMPATARWTARKAGLDYTAERINDRDLNIALGTHYLKYVLEDFEGSQALAAAAYNAGPSRPRRWRQGPLLDAAAWAENIPFGETRDYVKKVLSNATYYAAILGDPAPVLRTRLGSHIGPPPPTAPAPNAELP